MNRVFKRLRRRLFPTARERLVAQWYRDGGETRLRFDYDLDAKSIVLDVGGYDGQWTSDIYARYRSKVFVFEPVEQFYADITKRFARNDDISVLCVGLGGSNRLEMIGVDDTASSLHSAQNGVVQRIEVRDAAQWLDDAGLAHVDLAKINIEGAEYELLERLLASGWVSRIRDLQIQFHDFVPGAVQKMQAIRSGLAATHEPTYQYEFVWENWRRRH